MPDLLAVVDRALTRARRHAAILPGHDLSDDLALVEMAAADIAAAIESADLIAGHQLCSDLAVLTANAEPAAPSTLAAARRAWHARRTDPRSQVIDTRFDTG